MSTEKFNLLIFNEGKENQRKFLYEKNPIAIGGEGKIYRGWYVDDNNNRISETETFALKFFEKGTKKKKAQKEAWLLNKKTFNNTFLIEVLSDDPTEYSQLIMISKFSKGKNIVNKYANINTQSKFSVTDSLNKLSFSERLQLCEEYAFAIQNLHHRKKNCDPVFHGNIKDGNIKVEFTEHPLSHRKVFNIDILDFGFSKIIKKIFPDSSSYFDQFSTIEYGTPGYAGPEMIKHWGTLKSDIYSLVAIFLIILGAIDPFKAKFVSNTKQALSQDYDFTGLLAGKFYSDFETHIGKNTLNQIKNHITLFLKRMENREYELRPDIDEVTLFFSSLTNFAKTYENYQFAKKPQSDTIDLNNFKSNTIYLHKKEEKFFYSIKTRKKTNLIIHSPDDNQLTIESIESPHKKTIHMGEILETELILPVESDNNNLTSYYHHLNKSVEDEDFELLSNPDNRKTFFNLPCVIDNHIHEISDTDKKNYRSISLAKAVLLSKGLWDKEIKFAVHEKHIITLKIAQIDFEACPQLCDFIANSENLTIGELKNLNNLTEIKENYIKHTNQKFEQVQINQILMENAHKILEKFGLNQFEIKILKETKTYQDYITANPQAHIDLCKRILLFEYIDEHTYKQLKHSFQTLFDNKNIDQVSPELKKYFQLLSQSSKKEDVKPAQYKKYILSVVGETIEKAKDFFIETKLKQIRNYKYDKAFIQNKNTYSTFFGFLGGYTTKTKLKAADLLIDTIRNKNPEKIAAFFSADNKILRKALAQGHLGKLSQELIQYLESYKALHISKFYPK